MTFTIETTDYYGLATFLVYVLPHKSGISFSKNAQRLSSGKLFRCLFDTGANRSMISSKVAQQINAIFSNNTVDFKTPNATSKVKRTSIDLLLPNNIVIDDLEVAVVDGTVDILIGTDIINRGDFALIHHDQKLYISCTWPLENHQKA